ncbi:alpha/beta hydrolase [Nakamurella sp.]|uniref:alpha/beta hydrolase n=1 Tax=Nakamurella sp. TaxID=1869182 RepID=UPI003B3A0D2E
MTDVLARSAIVTAARQLGHDDPVAAVDALTGVDVGALRAWRDAAAGVRRRLADGSDHLGSALPVTAQAWSAAAPRDAVRRHHEAGLAARDTVDRHLAAAQDTIGTLESTRSAAPGELARAADGLRSTGWPPGQDLLAWASANGRLPAVAAVVGSLAEAVRGLGRRNDTSLQALVAALDTDPAQAVDGLIAIMPAAFPGATTTPGTPTVLPVEQANLQRLASDLESDDEAVRSAAQGVRAALDRAAADGTAQLLIYEPAGPTSQGRAAIAVGDITTADTVVTMAPGVSSSLVEMGDGVHDAITLADHIAGSAPGGRTAVVAWYGYEAPLAVDGGTRMTALSTLANVTAAGNDVYARVGARQLVDDLAGFRALAPPGARFVGYGHSMGSTVVSAAEANGAGFDDLILAGSPGASVEVGSAHDYPGLGPDHVWVISFDNDPITTGITDMAADSLAGLTPGIHLVQPTPFGPDPAAAEFGARVVDVGSNRPDVEFHLGGPLGGLTDGLANDLAALHLHHNGGNYLDGASLDAVAAITSGQYDKVPIRPGR